MKNREVVEDFVRGYSKSKTKHLFIEGRVLYSYGYHFPLCIRLADGWAINSYGYSNTTATHKGHLCRELGFDNFKDLQKNKRQDILLLNTEQMKEVINQKLSSIAEILEKKI